MRTNKSNSLLVFLAAMLTALGAVTGAALLVAVFFAAYSAGFACLVFVGNAALHYVGGVHYLGFAKTLAVGALCNVARLVKGLLF